MVFLKIASDNLALIVGIGTSLVAIYNWVAKPLKKMAERDRAQDSDISMLLWDRLSQAHAYYMTRGWASAQEKERLIAMHKAYQDRGRNHLTETYEKDILALPEKP